MIPKCLFHQSGLPMSQHLPMSHQSIKLIIATLTQRRQIFTTAKNSSKIFKMKRSMNAASSDMSPSDLLSSDLSSNLSHTSLHGDDGEDRATKPSRRREKSTSGRTKSRGSPVKIGKLKLKPKDSQQSEQDTVNKEAQEPKSTVKEMTESVMTSSGSLSFQVQQMLEQSSPAELQSYSVLRERAAQYAAFHRGYQSNNSSNVQGSIGYNYAQTPVPFPFVQVMQPVAWTPTFYPSNWPSSLTTNSVTSHQNYHSSSQSSVPSQPLKKVCQSYEDMVKQVETDHCSGWKSISVIRTNMSETDSSEVSHVVVHWDQDGTTTSADMTTVSSAGGEGMGDQIPLDDYKTENYDKKLQNLPREWEYTPFGVSHRNHKRKKGNSGSRHAVEFSVMSYNILSQDLLDQHPYLYKGKTSRSLEWKQRRRGLIAEIACHNPDILNLQEVHRDHFLEYLKPRLNKLGYVGGYVKRTGDKSDGCATMWKKDKFRLLNSTPVSYCRGGLLDRDNIAVIVELQPVRPAHHHQSAEEVLEDKIVVANTHLLFNPRRGDIKLAQLMILMAEIDKHAYLGPAYNSSPIPSGSASSLNSMGKSRYCPIIMTGDLNLEPHSELYKFIISGHMQYEGQLANHLSGQEEGWYGRSIPLDRNFFSPIYGVTDSCQHHSAVIHRLNESLTSAKDRPATTQAGSPSENSLVSSHGSGSNSEQAEKSASRETLTSPMCQPGSVLVDSIPKAADSKSAITLPTSTGHVQHHLNLVSAYRHTIRRLGHREPEITTHHNYAQCSVDYILFSVNSKDVSYKSDELHLSNIRYDRLKLLAHYGLMSATEVDEMGGIPNTVLPSDHLLLMTKFLLQ